MSSEITLEAKVRVIKLVEVDGWKAIDALADLEKSFGIVVELENQNAETVVHNMKRAIIKQLSQVKDKSRSRLVKLLIQAQLLGTL